ncbi:chromosome partitioning protein, ParB family [Bradyrhizobium sp. Rc2d]|nr:chromosome partitioning protein, ParB family [Bradyrhizobium sp. Rc2d]
MTEAVQKITLSPSRDIRFNKLVLRQSKVRPLKAGISIEQFAKSITHRTLLQSLNVWPIVEAEANDTGMFEVPADGLRYRALGLLTKQKRRAKAQAVRFVVREGGVLEDEIISWELLMFVPTDASGIEIQSKVLASYPPAPIGEREAA